MVIFFTPVVRDIHALIKRRLRDARPHARARREVDDLIKFHGRKQFVERRTVGEIAMKKFKRLGERLDVTEVGALELRIVKIVQVIERPDAVAVAEQPFAHVRADEARAAGDEKIHGRKLNRGGRSVERSHAM